MLLANRLTRQPISAPPELSAAPGAYKEGLRCEL